MDPGSGSLPERFTGVVFSNEFFDSLPVRVVRWAGPTPRELLVDYKHGAFTWVEGGRAGAEIEDYLRTYLPPPSEPVTIEVNLEALRWIERISRSVESGFHFTIDYGYTRDEARRFPRGTLMSYTRHMAREDVLCDPGNRDITAHVCFTALQERGAALGLEIERFETLARTLLAAGQPDQFGAALAAPTAAQEAQRRLQLKTLLFGMGETFRTLLQRKVRK